MIDPAQLQRLSEWLSQSLLNAVRVQPSLALRLTRAGVVSLAMVVLHQAFFQDLFQPQCLLLLVPVLAGVTLLWGWRAGLFAAALCLGLRHAPFTGVVEDAMPSLGGVVVVMCVLLTAALIRDALILADRSSLLHRAREERLSFSLKSAGVGAWDMDMRTQQPEWSDSFRRMMRMPSDLPPSVDNFFAEIHPEDRLKVRAAMAAAEQTGRFRAEFRLHPRKGVRWILSLGSMFFDREGHAERFSGVLLDITQIKRTFQVMRESRRMFEIITDVSALAVVVATDSGEVLYGNRFWRTLSGVNRVGMRGRKWWDLVQFDELNELKAAWEVAQSAHTPFSREVRVRSAGQQEARWFTAQGVPLKRGRQRASEWLIVLADVHVHRSVSERIQHLGDNLPQGAIYQAVDLPAGGTRLTYVSAGVQRLLGCPAHLLMNDVCLLCDRIFEEDRELFLQGEQQARRTRKPFEVQFRVPTVEGGIKWLLCRAAPSIGQDGRMWWDGVLFDVTARRLAELEVQASERKFKNLADAVPQLVWSCLGDGRAEFFNGKWVQYTGQSAVAWLRSDWLAAVHPEDRGRVEERWRASLASGVPLCEEFRVLAATGEDRWFKGEVTATRDGRGGVYRWVGSCTDIHDQRCFNQEREALLSSERAARAEAERANKSKDQFVAVLSHELRSPLHAIAGWVQIIKRGTLDAAGLQRAVDVLEKNTRLQAQLISDLLDINRIAAGKIKLSFAKVEIDSVVEAAVMMHRITADEKGVTLAIEPCGACVVQGDTNRLQQVISNLVSNAIKFTPRGGSVTVRSYREQDRIVVSVVDTGEGIEPEFIGRVFERYSQADPSAIRKHGGLGLGLSIVKHLVELHGGEVRVSSAGKGKGSEFKVALPVAADQQLDGDGVPAQLVADGCLEGASVLVVDDEQDSRELLVRLLQEHGAEVVGVAGVDEALVRAQARWPDVVVSDISMPGKDGYTLLRELTQLSPGHTSPAAVAVTAFARDQDRERIFQAGFKRHLAKPIDASELVLAVRQLWEGQRGARLDASLEDGVVNG
jgi:PAS domain S-box-containing protein